MSVRNPPEASHGLWRIEDRLQQALLAGRMATWEWDPETDEVIASELMDALVGLRPGDSLAQYAKGFSLVHPEDRENHRALVEAAVRTRGAWHNEFRIVRPVDGEVIWVEERAHAVRNLRTGGFTMAGVVWDITERKHAEEALRESEARQALLLELADTLRPLNDVQKIVDAACRLLNERAGFCVAELAEHVASSAAIEGFPREATGAERRLYREAVERVRQFVERARSEQAVRRSEEKYRALFTAIDEGFCIQEVIFDEYDRAIDLRYLEVNRAFEALTGLRRVEGRTAHELLLDVQASWLRVQAEVALTGEPVRFENYVAAWDRWFDIYSVRIGAPSERKVASVFSDITERRRAERRLRQAAEFDAFRVALNDALRSLDDPLEIQATAVRVLGARLHATRAFYAEVVSEGDAEWLAVKPGYGTEESSEEGARVRLAATGGTLIDELRAGRIVVVSNVEGERRFTRQERDAYLARDVCAFVDLPLVRGGNLVAVLSVQHDVPRAWLPEDVARIEEAAQRTWAAVERARAEAALREWEARLDKAFSIQTVGVLFFDLRGRIIEANAAFQRMSGYTHDELMAHTHWETLTPPEFVGVTADAARDLALRGETAPYEKQLVRRDGSRWWGLFAPTRLARSGLDSECVEFVLDITASKRTEEELRRAREDLELRVRERTRELAETNASLRSEVAERRRAEEARNELMRQLVNAQEDERRRISRELHDELGQQVSALNLKLAMLRIDGELPPHAREQVESLEKIARKTDSDLDFLVWQLRPTALDDLGLVAALRDHADQWSEHFGIACELHAPSGEEMRLDPEVETVLYRVGQEALNNIAKHARARRVELRLERGASHASLTIDDDGVGFDAEAQAHGARGLGLVGMRERASLIGGQFSVRSKPGEGTRIKVDVPLPTAT